MFYGAGGGLEDNSGISDFDIYQMVPDFTCTVCGQYDITTNYNYPQLRTEDILSRDEIDRLGPVMERESRDEEMLRLVNKLRKRWNVPITAGTIFGPTRIKVGKKVQQDVHVLLNHAGFLCRRRAAEALKGEGIAMDYVRTPATGKYAEKADYVEIVVPVMGHQKLPPDRSFCNECLRYGGGTSFRTILIEESLPKDQPFFKTIEGGLIVFSDGFIGTVKRLGLKGFVEGKTLHLLAIAKQSEPWDSEYDRRLKEKRAKDWQELVRKVREREENNQERST